MKGEPKVIEYLNKGLRSELTAINQYFLHSRICRNWGYARLADYIHKESIDEMKHADKLIERILYLEGVPNIQRYNKVNVGETVPEQFALDLALERAALQVLNDGLKLCRDHNDHGSEDLLRKILVAEEDHADWLETQLGMIKEIGVENYLARQVE